MKKKKMPILLAAVLVVTGVFVCARQQKQDAYQTRLHDSVIAMDENFALLLDGWRVEQARLLFENGFDRSELDGQMATLVETFGACRLVPDYTCDAQGEVISCSFYVTCDNRKGLGDVSWVEVDDILKIQELRMQSY